MTDLSACDCEVHPQVKRIRGTVISFEFSIHFDMDDMVPVWSLVSAEDLDGGFVVDQRLLRPGLDFGTSPVLAELVCEENIGCKRVRYGLCVEGLYAVEEFLDRM